MAPLEPPFFDPDRLHGLIARQGVWVDWYRTVMCPCRKDSGQPQARHVLCAGTGYMRPYPAERIRGLLTGDEKQRKKLQGGTVETGTRSFTPRIPVRLSEGDMIVTTQGPRRMSEVLTYGAPRAEDSLINMVFVTQILSVIGIGALDTPHIFDPALYTADDGSMVGADGAILWRGDVVGVLPDPGSKITVEYLALDAFQVARGALPMSRYTQDQQIMDRVVVKEMTRRSLRGAPIV